MVAQLPHRLKSMFFEKFSLLQVSFGNPPTEKISKTLILGFEANSALSRENGFFPGFRSLWFEERNWLAEFCRKIFFFDKIGNANQIQLYVMCMFKIRGRFQNLDK